MSTQQRIERHDALYTLINMLPGESFGKRPACADADPEIFFPEPGQSAQIAEAKSWCDGTDEVPECPLRAMCLRVALRRGEHGVWGGTTEAERDELRRADRRAERVAAQAPEIAGDEVAAAVERALVEVERATGTAMPGLRRRVEGALAAASRRGETDAQRADAALVVLRPVLASLGAGPGEGFEGVAA